MTSGEYEDEDLPAQEGIPDAAQFIAEPVEVLRIAGDIHLEKMFSRNPLLSDHDKIGDGQDEEQPAKDFAAPPAKRAHQIPGLAEQRLDKREQLLADAL